MKLIAVLAIALTCGCAASAGQTPSDQRSDPPSRAPWSLTLQQSGGFAGLMRTLQVPSSGDASAEDSRRQTRVATKATPEELAALNAFIAQQVPSRQAVSGSCADCFLYELEVDAGGRRSNFRFDDATLMASGIEPTVRTLVAMLTRALTNPPSGTRQ